MSYILEALKKSELARQQGKVPNIASLPMVDARGFTPPARGRLPLLASGALLLAVAVAGWWRPWLAPATATPGAPAAVADLSAVSGAPVLVAANVSPKPAAPAAISAAEPATAVTALATPQTDPSPLAAMQERTRSEAPATAMQAAPPKVVLPVLVSQPGAAHETLAATARPPAATSSALPAPPSRVLAFYELPPSVRERIPALAISGFSYAEEPDMRMAVINDRVLRQGESAAPGITLERIASDGVVLNFSGYRFRPQR